MVINYSQNSFGKALGPDDRDHAFGPPYENVEGNGSRQFFGKASRPGSGLMSPSFSAT